MVTIFEPDLNKSVKVQGVPTLKSQRQCPVCQAKSSLILFGSRASSLSSVAIHQSFSSPINDDKKLIAFSDSVQDAAHRAGFFAARTWHNNVRMALSKAIHSRDDLIPLNEFYTYLPKYWLDEKLNSSALQPLNYITQFIAPNMESNEDFLNLLKDGVIDNPGNLVNKINICIYIIFNLKYIINI
jgi:DEAD/DEAH box helicase domain-containing protein